MGYNLRIGEAKLEYDEDLVRVDCEVVKRDDAPAFGDPTDYQSQRCPSYTCWFESMEQLGLVDVMFNRRNGGTGHFTRGERAYSPLLEGHPGAMPITRAHAEEVEERLGAYKARHPDHVAQYPPLKPGAVPIVAGSDWYAEDQYVDDPRFDSALCRGEWLAFWLRWAVEHCRQPVFVNS
jgi:hypothetical protein